MDSLIDTFRGAKENRGANDRNIVSDLISGLKSKDPSIGVSRRLE